MSLRASLPLLPVAATLLSGCASCPPPSDPREPNTLTEQEVDQGWTLLFDGGDMDAWRGYRQESVPEGWKVQDGAITRVDGGGDIITRETFDDFELSLQWRIAPGGNSGIFYNVVEDDRFQYVWQTGPEMQVLDNARHVDGADALTSAGANYALHAPPRDVTRPVGEWNDVRIIVDGDHVEHWLNGEKIVAYELHSPDWRERVANSKFASMPDYGSADSGHIALQDHGDWVQFRNIRIRRLD